MAPLAPTTWQPVLRSRRPLLTQLDVRLLLWGSLTVAGCSWTTAAGSGDRSVSRERPRSGHFGASGFPPRRRHRAHDEGPRQRRGPSSWTRV